MGSKEWETMFIGLLTHQQKRAGYFMSQDEDFIFLFQGKNSDKPDCIAIFLYETATVKEIRDTAEADMVKRAKVVPQKQVKQRQEYIKSKYEGELE